MMTIRLAGAAFAGALLLAGCGASEATPAAPPPAPASAPTEFVGEISGVGAFIALVLGPGDAVKGYVCDGLGGWENYTGTVSGGKISLTSADGDSALAATSAPAPAGTVTFGGQTRDFTTTEITGIGGFYDVDFIGDDTRDLWAGTSWGGNTITATREGDTLARTITTADGKDHPLVAKPDAPLGVSELSLIVRDDGAMRGSPKPGAKTRGAGSGELKGFVDWLMP